MIPENGTPDTPLSNITNPENDRVSLDGFSFEDTDELPDHAESDVDYLWGFLIARMMQGRYEDLGLTEEELRSDETPQLLFCGRDDETRRPKVLLLKGRSAVKKMFNHRSKKLYKALRQMMQTYDMGPQIPAAATGAGGGVVFEVIYVSREDYQRYEN